MTRTSWLRGACQYQADLALELYRAYPDHGDLKRLQYDRPRAYTYKQGQSPWNGGWATGQIPLSFLVNAKRTIVSLSYRNPDS